MNYIFAALILMTATSIPVMAQATPAKAIGAVEREIVELEKKWNDAIQRQDLAQMELFLADSYFLAGGMQGRPLRVVPRERWLENLKSYKVHSYSIDDIKVSVYGDMAVVLMLYTQKATVGHPPTDRSAQFVLTDVWVKQKSGWRVAQRHSSRPEQPTAASTKAVTFGRRRALS